MNVGHPSLRPRPEGAKTVEAMPVTEHGVPDVMLDGFKSVKSSTGSVHPLEFSEKHWVENQQKMDDLMLRNSQGMHAPLRLHMERKTALKMQRLPGMMSSNLMRDTLTGRLDIIDFDDVLGNAADQEVVGQPHAMIERQLGLL